MALGTSKIFGKVLTVAALLAAQVFTASWVFYADDRLPSHSMRIGTLRMELPEGSSTGTAFLVDECGILTNFHVVFGPWYVTALRRPSHAFTGTFTLTEVTLPDGAHPAVRAIPVVWGDYLGPERQWRRPEEDWVYLTLERCLGSRYGWYDLREPATYEPAVDKGFSAIGYSAGRQMADPHCAARADPAADAKGWLHDCAALSGDSGGPVFRNGSLNVIAMASAYRAGSRCPSARPEVAMAWLTGSGGCANIAVPVTTAMREALDAAVVAVGAQRILRELGYDPGPIGLIEGPLARGAIMQAQREMGWPVTGVSSWRLNKVLQLRRASR